MSTSVTYKNGRVLTTESSCGEGTLFQEVVKGPHLLSGYIHWFGLRDFKVFTFKDESLQEVSVLFYPNGPSSTREVVLVPSHEGCILMSSKSRNEDCLSNRP